MLLRSGAAFEFASLLHFRLLFIFSHDATDHRPTVTVANLLSYRNHRSNRPDLSARKPLHFNPKLIAHGV